MLSLGFTWSHLDSLGLTWSHLDSLGLTWSHLDSLAPTPPDVNTLAHERASSLATTTWPRCHHISNIRVNTHARISFNCWKCHGQDDIVFPIIERSSRVRFHSTIGNMIPSWYMFCFAYMVPLGQDAIIFPIIERIRTREFPLINGNIPTTRKHVFL